MILKGKEIVLGVTGSIACYKSVDLVSRLRKLGANVNVIMTGNATEFVSVITFQTISCNSVYADMFKPIGIREHEIKHISLAKRADIIIVAPATANIISKLAWGIADDPLSATVLACRCTILVAPAMNESMYRNPILQENIRKLKKRGFRFIGPASGRLACDEEGEGRMVEPEEIVEEIVALIGVKQDLEEKKILVTAGPTREFIDPVRYISNPSSGKMGFALAQEARDRGGKVVLISGPTNLALPDGVKFMQVLSAEEMEKEVLHHFDDSDIVIMSAAVSDWKPSVRVKEKIKMKDELNLRIESTSDILAELGKRKGKRILVGFALETENLIKNAKEKLKEKNLDLIVANKIKGNYPFGSDTNKVVFIERNGKVTSFPKLHKSEIARRILDRIKP